MGKNKQEPCEDFWERYQQYQDYYGTGIIVPDDLLSSGQALYGHPLPEEDVQLDDDVCVIRTDRRD